MKLLFIIILGVVAIGTAVAGIIDMARGNDEKKHAKKHNHSHS